MKKKSEGGIVFTESAFSAALARLGKNRQQLLDATKDLPVATELTEDLETLQESLWLTGLTAMLNGSLSLETVTAAVQTCIEDMHKAEQIAKRQENPSYGMTSCQYKVVATFPDSFIYGDETGKLYQCSYHIEGTSAILDGSPQEVIFQPTAVGAKMQEQQESVAIIEGFMGASSLKQGKINRELNVIEGTTLIGPISKNTGNGSKGRRYSEAALKKIASMAEGLPGYLNHVAPELAFKPRDVKDLAVRHRNVRFDPATQTVKSDMHVMPNHADLVFSLAEQFGDHIGNSVVSRGLVTMEGDTEVVQDVIQLRSADLVSDPASTKGLFEGKGSDETPVTLIDLIEALQKKSPPKQEENTMDLAAILAHFKEHPETQKLVLEHLQVVPKGDADKAVATVQESIVGLTKERDALKGDVEKAGKDLQEAKVKIGEFEAKDALAQKRTALAEAIGKHKLSTEFGKVKGAVSDEFKSLLEGMDEDKWVKQLDDRYNALKGVPQGEEPKSRVKDDVITEAEDEKQIPAGSHQRLLRAVTR